MEHNISPYSSLPPEIWCNIIQFVEQITDLVAIRRVCKTFSLLAKEENINNYFGYDVNKGEPDLPFLGLNTLFNLFSILNLSDP